MINKIKALIIDDEQLSANLLKRQLSRHCEAVEILEICTSPELGLKAISNLKPNVVFLDIDMPRMTGFELLKLVPEINFDIIFTTAFDNFALQAFRVSAIDYLIKPVDESELINAVEKVRKKKSAQINNSISHLLEQIQSQTISSKLFLPTLSGCEFIEKNTIIRCEADGNYCEIYLNNDSKRIISKTLGEVEQLLSDSVFFRSHHSHIVNLEYVRKYMKGDGGQLVLMNGEIIPVSRAKKRALMTIMNN